MSQLAADLISGAVNTIGPATARNYLVRWNRVFRQFDVIVDGARADGRSAEDGAIWLVADRVGGLHVRSTHDADDTLAHDNVTPLLVCDLWEHAYYLDHQNDRKGFLEAWLEGFPNWKFAERQFEASKSQAELWHHSAPFPALEPKLFNAS